MINEREGENENGERKKNGDKPQDKIKCRFC